MCQLSIHSGLSIIFLSTFVGSQWGKPMAGCFDLHIEDICNTDTDVVPYLSSRDPSTTLTNETLQRKYCDLFAMEKQQWYRSEINMTTTCPEMYKCGAKFPVWMNGSQPEPDEGIVNRTACLRDFENCCLIRYRLAAINCGQYLAYCLLDLPSGCPQRYCFDRETSLSSSGELTTFSWSRNASIHTTTALLSDPEEKAPFMNVKGMVLDKELIIIMSVVFVFTAVVIFVFLMFRRQWKIEDKLTSSTKEAPKNKFKPQNMSGLVCEKADSRRGDIYKLHYTNLVVNSGDLSSRNETDYSTLNLYETI